MIIVLTTYPERKSANAAARKLVQGRLAACVNVVKIESSLFRWKGRLRIEKEYLLMIKARARDYRKLESAIRSDHPYSLPEIIRLRVDGGLPDYIAWVEKG